MNKLIIAVVILGVCAAANIKCTEQQKKAQMCTMEYMPVCGVKVNSSNGNQTVDSYPNKCSACSEKDVEFYAVGHCDEYPKEATFCHPDAPNNLACTREFNPVCGLFDSSKIRCIRAPCGQTYPNKCTACTNADVTHLIKGDC